jgi:glycosyltransferase involved in cell wall biosynthesis
VSAFTAAQVHDLLGVERDRLRVVHHGVRPLNVPPVSREPVILTVGAIQARKNIARLVEAFETLDPEWRLVIAGSRGYGADQALRRIEESPCHDRIRLLGYISTEELAGWYARASLFVFPSLDEGFGMPVLEAMAAGVPVIASNRAAVPEVAGDAAILVDPDDTEALSNFMQKLANNEELRSEMARRGRARAAGFSWHRAVEATWGIYAELGMRKG